MKEHIITDSEYIFKDYCDTKRIYHIAPVIKLKEILERGLKVDESCSSKYCDFNTYFDKYKPDSIPEWVSRKEAIYGSLNFRKDHKWHSHSVLLACKIHEERCWVGNENLANILYEPFALRDINIFPGVNRFLESHGKQFVLRYWKNSLSFVENLVTRLDKYKGYDAEILVMHDIPPEDISIISIISDHKIMSVDECNHIFSNMLQM